MEGRKWFAFQLKQLGMLANMDGAGNVIGRYEIR